MTLPSVHGFVGAGFMPASNPKKNFLFDLERGHKARAYKLAFQATNMLVISEMKVLIAEDDRDSRELLGWLLKKLGYQVVATENGKQAWESYRKERFRIVISDLLMPDIDGLELVRRIRAHKQAKYTYIILITALIGKKDYLEGMDAGADDFVTKPFDPDELKARLRVAERIISFQEDTAVADDTAQKGSNTS